MKIGLINNLYKPYHKGGAERVVEILHNELKELGYDVFIISTKPRTSKDNEEKNVYYLLSCYAKLNRFSKIRRLIWQINNLINLKKYQEIKQILTKEKPNLVITNNLMGLGLLTPLAIKKLAITHFHTLHDIQLIHPSGLMYYGQEKIINSVFAKIYQKITASLFNQGVKIISPSKWLLNLHQDKGLFKNNETKIITNPFISNQINIIKKPNRNFIFIGQLEYHKGIDLFVKAAARFTDYNFLVAGDGSLEITETHNLKVLGRKTSEEVSELLANSLAVIIPSRCYENSPTVIYEAAAVKTPAIAANLGGIPELIEKFGGLLFEPDNLDSLVMAIEQFIAQGVALKENIDNESYVQKIISYYKKISA